MTDQPPAAGDPGSAAEQSGGQAVGAGYVFGQTFGVRPVVYSVEGDLAVFEGDIVLGTVEAMAARTALVEQATADELGAIAIPDGRSRWPDGVVPYELDPALPEAQRAAVANAVAHWNTHSRLALVPRDAA